MTHDFDKDYWERHWQQDRAGDAESMGGDPPNPTSPARPPTRTRHGTGRGVRRGCRGDLARVPRLGRHRGRHLVQALARAAGRAAANEPPGQVRWVEADLSTWRPDTRFDLVTTHYAHPAMPQLDFYDRIAHWVAPAGRCSSWAICTPTPPPGTGTTLPRRGVGHIRGHHRTPGRQGMAGRHRRRDPRTLTGHEGRAVTLHDVVVRATRRR